MDRDSDGYPEACDLCGAPARNYTERTYPYWRRYECGRKFSPAVAPWPDTAPFVGWSYGSPAGCLRRQLERTRQELDELRTLFACAVAERGVLTVDRRTVATMSEHHPGAVVERGEDAFRLTFRIHDPAKSP